MLKTENITQNFTLTNYPLEYEVENGRHTLAETRNLTHKVRAAEINRRGVVFPGLNVKFISFNFREGELKYRMVFIATFLFKYVLVSKRKT